jgi:hypothetical protein
MYISYPCHVGTYIHMTYVLLSCLEIDCDVFLDEIILIIPLLNIVNSIVPGHFIITPVSKL